MDYILAIFVDGILEAFRHEDVASEDASEGRPLNLVDCMSEVISGLFLFDGQL